MLAAMTVSPPCVNNAQVLRLHAVDCDNGLNARVLYSVDKPSYFAVNASTGVVSVWNRLDTGTATEHVLQVSADRRRTIGGTSCRHL